MGYTGTIYLMGWTGGYVLLALLTFDGDNSVPVWSPDGERVAFSSGRYGSYNLMWKRADGGGADVDENPQPGRFILTGSQHFGLTAAGEPLVKLPADAA